MRRRSSWAQLRAVNSASGLHVLRTGVAARAVQLPCQPAGLNRSRPVLWVGGW